MTASLNAHHDSLPRLGKVRHWRERAVMRADPEVKYRHSLGRCPRPRLKEGCRGRRATGPWQQLLDRCGSAVISCRRLQAGHP
jgi:hypothetical protein